MPWMWAKPVTSVGAVERLELVELGAVDEPRDHLAHVVLLLEIDRHDAVELAARRISARRGLASGMSIDLRVFRLADDAAAERQRMAVVLGVVVGDAGLSRVHVGAAEILRRDHLAGRRLHQRRPAEEDRALVAHDDGLVRHRRHVGAAGGAGAHDHRDLRDARRRQRRLIVEDAAEMLAVGKDLGLVRQVGAAGIDEIDARQPVLARDLLRAQMLLHRHRIIGAALDRGVVADDHAFAPGDAADAGDDAGGVNGSSYMPSAASGDNSRNGAARIDQRHHPVARQELAAGKVALASPRRPAFGRFGAALFAVPRPTRASPSRWCGTLGMWYRRSTQLRSRNPLFAAARSSGAELQNITRNRNFRVEHAFVQRTARHGCET